ncbi:hypothetical protein [Pontibacter sp. SGAir0037]|uniref:hypothetical protein n=1 Tax=Pontibacter sp. SGAir0037 TaxID=2571030 RepID=UPI0010F5C308|nr:hypothetical protein [Pontibacter sp. SGAir0037]
MRRETVIRARVALSYFTLVALMGLLLRWQLYSPVEVLNYRNLLHAHSHVALLGWLYCAFFAALLYAFPPETEKQRHSFNRQFYLTQVSVLGMLFSFPVQGYALFSITFSTLHILLSYWFAWSFWKHVKQNDKLWRKYKLSLQFIAWALLFLVLSTIGPWALGPIMAKGMAGGKLYYSAIYFYLHFQYNGWFTFAVLGLLFWYLRSRGICYSKVWAKRVYTLMVLACVPAFALSVLWAKPGAIWFGIGGIAAVLQMMALGYLLKLLWEVREELARELMPWVKGLFLLALLALSLKLVLQVASAVPYFADLAYNLRYFIIGYLHLSLIGFVSVFMLGFFVQLGLYRLGKYGKIGLVLLLLFFFISEAFLFLQGTLLWLELKSLPNFNLLMFIISIGMPVGLLLFFFEQKSLYLYRQRR